MSRKQVVLGGRVVEGTIVTGNKVLFELAEKLHCSAPITAVEYLDRVSVGEMLVCLVLIGMALLLVSFDWQAYLVVNDDASSIIFGDQEITFCSSNSGRIREASLIFNQFELKSQSK